MIELVRALSSRQGTLSQCALAIAVDPAPLAEAHSPAPAPAHAPALAPAPAPLSPPQSFLPSEVDIAGVRLSFGTIGSSGVVQLSSAPVGPDAQ